MHGYGTYSFSGGFSRKPRGVLSRFLLCFRNLDPVIFACTLVLSLFSLLSLYGGLESFGMSRLMMQAGMTVLGIVLMTVISNIDYRFLVNRFWTILLAASVLLLVYTLVFGEDVGENRSWIVVFRYGSREITVQPSEFIKITFICTFAKHLTIVGKEINRPLNLLGLALHAGVIIGLILLSGDLGVALVYVGIVILMLFAAGMSLFYDLGIGVLFASLFPFLWKHLATYQQERIQVGFNPWLDPGGKGYQPLLSRDAMINGGWFGRGLFGGEIYQVLPASHTDFMFGTVCEKFGFLGGFCVIIMLCILVCRILYLASELRDGLGRLVAVGVGAMVMVQSIENIGMCLAVLPVIGITLPFISYGGSSMLAIYLLFGVLHSAIAHGRG